MNDSKKKATKKIVLKNKKEATRILSRKSSDKNQNKKLRKGKDGIFNETS